MIIMAQHTRTNTTEEETPEISDAIYCGYVTMLTIVLLVDGDMINEM